MHSIQNWILRRIHFSDFRDLDFRKNILESANDFPDAKFRSRDRARPRPRALRGIPRMAGLVAASAPRPPWMAAGPRGSVCVVPRTSWVKSNRFGGAGRRLKNIHFSCSQKDSTSSAYLCLGPACAAEACAKNMVKNMDHGEEAWLLPAGTYCEEGITCSSYFTYSSTIVNLYGRANPELSYFKINLF